MPLRLIRPAALVTAYVLLSFYVTAIMVLGSQFTCGMQSADANRMLAGTASRPVAYRMLVPAVARLLVEATPDSAKDVITSGLKAFRDSRGVANIIAQHNPYPHDMPPSGNAHVQSDAYPHSPLPGSEIVRCTGNDWAGIIACYGPHPHSVLRPMDTPRRDIVTGHAGA